MNKSRDFRYLKKILTSAEIEFICNSEYPDKALWSFWACKETVYKTIRKSYAGLPFLPRQWSVRLNRRNSMFTEGEVIIAGADPVFVRIFDLPAGCMHCIGADNLTDLNDIIWGIEILPESASGEDNEPSSFGRRCLTRKLAGLYQLNFRELEVRRGTEGGELQPPQLYYENKKTPFDISLSHDGKFVAYAFFKRLN
ncbi:MAG TPA: 4'-phosphopantetheinyl transferase superfamily protein [Smithellaceae bacterium]|nr:4'-phosphopantetheinyl transferase superfamily protein [Smithellaceae bacterium]